jgi:DNA (cytosine-5)-methyltransferase 1
VDNPKKLTTVELAAGYGGLGIGLALAGESLRHLAYCEREAYAIANLIAKMEQGALDPSPIWTDCATFPGSIFRDRVDILLAGYPCQPFSQAGRRKGHGDPRNLWPHIIRGIEEMRPMRILLENVEGHIKEGLSEVLADLVGLGYRMESRDGVPTWGIFSAREIGASHVRKRLFILAYRPEWLAHPGSQRRRETRQHQLQAKPWPGSPKQRLAYPDKLARQARRPPEIYNADRKPDGPRNRRNPLGNPDAALSRSLPRRTAEKYAMPGSPSQILDDAEHHRFTRRNAEREWAGSTLPPNQDMANADSDSRRSPHNPAPGEGLYQGGDLGKLCDPRFPTIPECAPGPASLEAWEQILTQHPDLEPALCRLAHARLLRNRVDRLRLGGNGVVPQTVALAWQTLNALIAS